MIMKVSVASLGICSHCNKVFSIGEDSLENVVNKQKCPREDCQELISLKSLGYEHTGGKLRKICWVVSSDGESAVWSREEPREEFRLFSWWVTPSLNVLVEKKLQDFPQETHDNPLSTSFNFEKNDTSLFDTDKIQEKKFIVYCQLWERLDGIGLAKIYAGYSLHITSDEIQHFFRKQDRKKFQEFCSGVPYLCEISLGLMHKVASTKYGLGFFLPESPPERHVTWDDSSNVIHVSFGKRQSGTL